MYKTNHSKSSNGSAVDRVYATTSTSFEHEGHTDKESRAQQGALLVDGPLTHPILARVRVQQAREITCAVSTPVGSNFV